MTLPSLLETLRPRRRAALVQRAAFAAIAFTLCAAAVPLHAAGASEPPSSGATDTAPRQAPPLPPFQGRTLDGKSLSISSFLGKRLILFCFNPGVEEATAYAQAVAALLPERSQYNFAVVGVAMGLDPAKAREFASRLKLDFPIFDDSDGEIVRTLGLESPLVLIGSDAKGRVGMAVGGLEHEAAPSVGALEASVREYLRLPPAGAVVNGKLDEHPMAPPFEAERMSGGAPFHLSDVSGKPLVLAFFLSTCPHCQQALAFFKSELARMPEKVRPTFLGVATDQRSWAVESALKEKKIDFFPVLLDPDRKVAATYGSFAGVPDILMIDAAGRIVSREMGWDEKRDPNLMRMRLARLAGTEVPMLLDRDGFSGNDACAICHTKEAATWGFTSHAFAFDTLVTRGSERDPKCVGCHVVGFGERGGYSERGREEHLENVGCEDCHGRGGGHLTAKPKTPVAVNYKPACERCHDPQHSLGFDYATFLPKISHAVIASLGDAERAKLVTDRDRPRDLLPKTSAYAGSTACRNCHAREYDIWSRSAHARSIGSLQRKDKDDDARCVTCHVTGYGRPGGFPDGGRVRSNEGLARVGCESCHGAGAEHVRSGGKQLAGVVGLGDKCDSCVIMQICGTCHDDANDPGFRFSVDRKIEIQRHGAARAAAVSAH